jgi:hypothetical protein
MDAVTPGLLDAPPESRDQSMVLGTNAPQGVKNFDSSEARGVVPGEGFDLGQRGTPAPRLVPWLDDASNTSLRAEHRHFSPLRASAYCRCAPLGVQWMAQQVPGAR